MLKNIIPVLLIFTALSFAQETTQPDFNSYYNKGVESYQKKDFKRSIASFSKALELDPSSANTKYNLACAYSLDGNKTEAVKLLNELLDKGQGLDAEADGDFNSIRESEEFKVILQKIQKLKTPVNNSQEAFTIKEKDLIPEGIAYDPRSGSFFISSIYKAKILRVDRQKNVKDFTTEKQDGLWAVLGMKVDSKRGVLWANSAAGNHTKGSVVSDLGKSGVFKYDLKTGHLIKKYLIQDTSVAHFFNDLAIASNGEIYITDSQTPSVYKISKNSEKPELFLEMKNFIYPNGIALSDDNKYLYVAHSNGVIAVDLKDKTFKELEHPDNISLNFIDGLCFYKNSLIGIQNFGSNRVARFFLNETGDKVKDLKVIEAYNPDFIIPTTGVIAGQEFYYIANSQLASFEQDGKIFPDEKLKDVVILKARLK